MSRNPVSKYGKWTLFTVLILTFAFAAVAVPAVAIQDETRSGNETANSTTNETADNTPANDPITADITIHQPRYITEPVDERIENGSHIYVARGEYLEIEPNNFEAGDVTNFGVRENEGVLTYDKTANKYILNTQKNSGTYHLRWVVSENEGTQEYTTKIRVEKADYTHVPSEQYDSLKDEAERGQSVISRLENAGDPDEPLDKKVEFAVSVLNFAHNPFSAFTGQFVALQILRFTTPAGWVDLTVIIGLVYILTRGLYGTIARLRKQLEKEEQIARREDKQYLQMYKGVLSGKLISDIDAIDDHQAAVLESTLGKNLFTALNNFWTVWGEPNLKKTYADAMGTVGYAVQVHRDESGNITSIDVLDPDDKTPMSDGGEPNEHGPSGDPGVGDLGGSTDIIALSNAPGDVIDAMTWEQVDSHVFRKNPDISAMDHLMVGNRDGQGDLISELNISIPEDFQSRQEFMEAIGHMIREIMESDFTDEESIPREDRAVLNNLMAFTTVLEDQYDVPMDLYWRACVWNAEGLSRDDEAESVIADITDAGSVVEDLHNRNRGDSIGS